LGIKPLSRSSAFLLSLPERAVRSATALAGGVLREIGDVTIPKTIRRSRLYQNVVEATLQFLIEQVGQVEGVYPNGEKLSEDFLVRRTAGNGIEMIGILTFRASPVWVLAALADATGTGRYLIREIAAALKDEGLLDRTADFSSVDQMLDGLEASAGRLASAINTPPLDVKGLREEWTSLQADLARIPPKKRPSMETLHNVWDLMKREAQAQNRTPFELSSLMAMSAMSDLPRGARWLSASARLAAGKTGSMVAGVLIDHYRTTLGQIREVGYVRYAVRQFRPYLFAAVSQFSPQRQTLTERIIGRRKRV
jgi:hypothetical protein